MQARLQFFRDKDDKGIVIMKRLVCDTLTPIQTYWNLVGDGHGFLLESIPGSYSFIGRFSDPDIIIIDQGSPDPWSMIPLKGAGLCFEQNGLPPFIGGYVGYMGYDMARGIENLPRPKIPSGFPDAMLGRVDTLVVFDHFRQSISLIHAIAEADVGHKEAQSRAEDAFRGLEDALYSRSAMPIVQAPKPCGIQTVSIDDEGFVDAVSKTKQYIKDGDIMQAVLSRRLKLDARCDSFDTYRRLRHINPSPYLFYIRLPGVTLIGSSPEVMVKLTNGRITSLPIAGTRPRGLSPEEDMSLAEDLMGDEKERAEHLMLLDLARSDVGRVAKPGTVRVTSREIVKYYSHVMHIVSRVEGDIRDGMTNIDVLRACFPAGTVSGAPKVRAMEIIDELEGMCRGPYAGAVGYVSFNGDVDTGIAIRTIFIRDKEVYLQAGAGIVWDSVPQNEIKEIDNKLRALGKALGGMS